MALTNYPEEYGSSYTVDITFNVEISYSTCSTHNDCKSESCFTWTEPPEEGYSMTLNELVNPSWYIYVPESCINVWTGSVNISPNDYSGLVTKVISAPRNTLKNKTWDIKLNDEGDLTTYISG